MTIEIPQQAWADFFEKLNAETGLLIDLRAETEGEMRLLAQSVPLQALRFEVGDACNNSLIIEFGPGRERVLQYQVVEPIRLILRKEIAGDHYHLLEIPAESGATVIHFHPGISPVVLAGLALPQVSSAAH